MSGEYSSSVMEGGAGLIGGGSTEAGSAPDAARADEPGAASVDILDSTGRLPTAHVGWLGDHLRRALGLLGAAGEVRVRVLADQAMSESHARFRGVEDTTDVLTFDLSGPGRPLDVDVLVCLDEAERRAEELGHPRQHELLLYMIHGVLHCLGHDDHDPEARARMHAEEDRLLRAIGVGAVFHAPGGGGSA